MSQSFMSPPFTDPFFDNDASQSDDSEFNEETQPIEYFSPPPSAFSSQPPIHPPPPPPSNINSSTFPSQSNQFRNNHNQPYGTYQFNRHPHSSYTYPVTNSSFSSSRPPFPPPQNNYKFYAFRNIPDLLEYISKTSDLNDSYIALPTAFLTRYKEPQNHSFPTFGYFIHK